MRSAIQRAFVVDLLAVSPFYDRYLVEALGAELGSVRLYAATYPYEPSYWESVPVPRAARLHDRVARLGIRDRRLRRALQLLEYTANWVELVRDARREAVDVVHIQWLPLLEMTDVELAGVRRLQRAGAAVVYTAHNALPHDGDAALLPRYRRAYHAMDHIIVHTRTERDRLVRGMQVPPEHVSVVPHGPMFHDLPRVSPDAARAELSLRDEEVILFFGLLRPYKGIEDLLQAMVHVVRERPRALLLLAGQGESGYLQSLSELIERLGLRPHVRTLERYVGVAEIPTLHAAATVAVLPYRSASQSGALFTVAAFEVPLVATAVGGLEEVLAPGGRAVLVPPSDPRALANGLVDLLSRGPDQRAAAAKALGDWARRDCSWERIAEETMSAYELGVAHRAATDV